jgi:hypothetical protein
MTPFDALPRTPLEHFRLHLFGAVLALRRALPPPADSPVLEFLSEYYADLDRAGFGEGDAGHARWWAAVEGWEEGARDWLPLARLRIVAGLDPLALALLFTIGFPEEDGRFGLVAEAAGAPDRRPTLSLVSSWWSRSAEPAAVASGLRRLGELGLVEVGNPLAPRGEWSLRVAPAVWEALRGERPARPDSWASYTEPGLLPSFDALVLPAAVAERAAALPRLLDGPAPRALLIRGPRSSGRRTFAAAVARALGRGLLQLDEPGRLTGVAGALATLLDAVPVVAVEAAPGETVPIPAIQAYGGPVALVLGRQGAVEGPGAEEPLSVELGVPEPALRARHWAAALGEFAPTDLEPLAAAQRMTAGTIRRAGRLAASEAKLAGRSRVDDDDVRSALRVLQSHALDRLATRVEVAGDWSDLAVGGQTRRELELLELRCRHRESLGDGAAPALGGSRGAGVRALFTGPSGCGKSLAARLLASVLGKKDLYAVDLSTVVDKYLGETEKNLEEILSRAEELDVVLLLDEGDALLGQRTDVRSSNDRYANLETNFLLQRLEAFEGVVVVTTNVGDRIDSAFRRRIDVVVEFRMPDAADRWALWQLHLPEPHDVDPGFLEEVAGRCMLSGGQIRNAVLHASLLAVEREGRVETIDVELAVRREYRKAGAACPLRTRNGAHA